MFESLLVVFREGLEAFLIVAIMLAYVTNAGHQHLKKPIYAGVIVALFISVTTAWHVAELAQDPLWEGTLSMIAGALVASFTLYIMKTAKNIRGDIHAKLEKSAQEEGALADIGVFAFTIFMVAREGMETAMMLGALTAQHHMMSIMGGAIYGLAAVLAVGYLWVTQSTKINLKLFLQVTGIFLILFSVHLFIYGLHELSEMALIPFIGDEGNMSFHLATEAIAEGPILSNLITGAMIAVPLLWLGAAYFRDKLYQNKDKNLAAK